MASPFKKLGFKGGIIMGKRTLISVFLAVALILVMVVNGAFASPSTSSGNEGSNDVFAYYTVESSSSFEANKLSLQEESNDQYVEHEIGK